MGTICATIIPNLSETPKGEKLSLCLTHWIFFMSLKWILRMAGCIRSLVPYACLWKLVNGRQDVSQTIAGCSTIILHVLQTCAETCHQVRNKQISLKSSNLKRICNSFAVWMYLIWQRFKWRLFSLGCTELVCVRLPVSPLCSQPKLPFSRHWNINISLKHLPGAKNVKTPWWKGRKWWLLITRLCRYFIQSYVRRVYLRDISKWNLPTGKTTFDQWGVKIMTMVIQ